MKELIGKKFEVITVKHPSGGSYKTISDEDYNFIKTELGATRLRIWLPGTIGTADLRGDRYNVHLSGDGVVKSIDVG
mgnify:FL=1